MAKPTAPVPTWEVSTLRSQLTGELLRSDEHEFRSRNRAFAAGDTYTGGASGTVYRVVAVGGFDLLRGQWVLAREVQQ